MKKEFRKKSLKPTRKKSRLQKPKLKTVDRQTEFKLAGVGSSTRISHLSDLIAWAKGFLFREFEINNLSTSESLRLLYCVEFAAKSAEKQHELMKRRGAHTIIPAQEGAYLFLMRTYGFNETDLFFDEDASKRERVISNIRMTRELAHSCTLDVNDIDTGARWLSKKPVRE